MIMRKKSSKIVKAAIKEDWDGKLDFSNTASDINRMVGSLQNRIEVNMVGRACHEALMDLNSYYKVISPTFEICSNTNHLPRSL